MFRAALMAGVDPSIGATAAAGLQGGSGGLIGELPVLAPATTGAQPMGQPMGETATLAAAGSGLAAPGSAPGYLGAAAQAPPPLASSPALSPVISPHTGALPGPGQVDGCHTKGPGHGGVSGAVSSPAQFPGNGRVLCERTALCIETAKQVSCRNAQASTSVRRSICLFSHLWCARCAVGVYPDTFSQPFRYDHVALQQAAPQSVPITAQPAALGASLLQGS